MNWLISSGWHWLEELNREGNLPRSLKFLARPIEFIRRRRDMQRLRIDLEIAWTIEQLRRLAEDDCEPQMDWKKKEST